MSEMMRDRDLHVRAAFDGIVDAFLGLPLPVERPGGPDAHRDCLHLGDLAITVTFPDGEVVAVPDTMDVRWKLGIGNRP